MAHEAPDEQLLLLDEEGLPTGALASSDDVHSYGYWHAAVHVWLLTKEGGVLLRRNPAGHRLEPLKLGASVEFHGALGDEAEQAAHVVERRLGASVAARSLVDLGSFRSEKAYSLGDLRILDREHVQAFAVHDARPLDAYVLDPRTTETIYDVPVARAVDLLGSGGYVPAPGFDSLRRVSNALLVEEDLPIQGREVLLSELRAVEDRVLDVDLTPPDPG